MSVTKFDRPEDLRAYLAGSDGVFSPWKTTFIFCFATSATGLKHVIRGRTLPGEGTYGSSTPRPNRNRKKYRKPFSCSLFTRATCECISPTGIRTGVHQAAFVTLATYVQNIPPHRYKCDRCQFGRFCGGYPALQVYDTLNPLFID